MKKIYFLLFLLCFSAFGKAQITCTPDPLVTFLGVPGIFPNQATGGMPDGDVGVAYTTTFTAVVPADTTLNIPGFGMVTLAIDAMNVTAVDGLPTGLAYACDAAACSWTGNSNGCFKVTGTPLAGGDFTVNVQTSVTVTTPLGPFSTPAFAVASPLHINGTASIITLQDRGFELGSNIPNPFKGITTIPFTSARTGVYQFTVSDINGRSVHSSAISATAGRNALEFDASQLAPGIYHFRFEQKGSFATGKMVVEK